MRLPYTPSPTGPPRHRRAPVGRPSPMHRFRSPTCHRRAPARPRTTTWCKPPWSEGSPSRTAMASPVQVRACAHRILLYAWCTCQLAHHRATCGAVAIVTARPPHAAAARQPRDRRPIRHRKQRAQHAQRGTPTRLCHAGARRATDPGQPPRGRLLVPQQLQGEHATRGGGRCP